MTKSRLASFLDACLISISVLIISLILASNFKLNIIVKLIISSIIASVCFMFYIKREKKRYKNQQIKAKDKTIYNQTIHTIKLMPSKEKQTYFNALFEKLKKQKELSNVGYTIIPNSVINSPQTALQTIIDETTENSYDSYYVILLENTLEHDLLNDYKISSKKNIILLETQDLYNLIKQQDSLPDLSRFEINKTSLKEKLKLILSNLFYKSNAKGFFISGLLLFISSLFVPFKKYYYTLTIIMLTVSLLCLIFGKRQKPAE